MFFVFAATNAIVQNNEKSKCIHRFVEFSAMKSFHAPVLFFFFGCLLRNVELKLKEPQFNSIALPIFRYKKRIEIGSLYHYPKWMLSC